MTAGVKTGVSKSHKPKRKPPRSESSPDQVLYLYGITRSGKFDVGTSGVDGRSAIEPLECPGCVCWVSRVSRRDFADELNSHMQNLDWLAGAGVRHQQAVAAIASQAEVLPARFATVFLSHDSLERHIRAEKPTLEAAFERISGCEEWGVKVYAVPRAAAPAVESIRSGREYLQHKAASLHSRAPRNADLEIEELVRELAKHSRDTASSTAQSSQPGLEWQASFLIPRKERDNFLRVTTRYAERWRDRRRIECTGPWPTYSFVAALGSGASQAVGKDRP
ncbi:MAG TPA: GvpL/GvpF family gas vesicle protein [Terriglobales bacterium]|nr:GvpL/GvpF family gas vesicle protein [Terriglobales bacterium]